MSRISDGDELLNGRVAGGGGQSLARGCSWATKPREHSERFVGESEVRPNEYAEPIFGGLCKDYTQQYAARMSTQPVPGGLCKECIRSNVPPDYVLSPEGQL